MQVAQTILHQIGGNKFKAMTGAKQFVGGENFLQFKLPSNFARLKINCVKIVLKDSDTYEMHFMNVWGTQVNLVRVEENIYADKLQLTFTSVTGLDTHL